MARSVPDNILTVENQPPLSAKSVLMITADNTEDLEFFYPYYRFIEEGYHVDIATPNGGSFTGKMGYKIPDTRSLASINTGDYDMLYIPGGKAPAELIKNETAIEITQSFVEAGKPVAAICHGPQLLAAADVIRGISIAAYPECEKEVVAAGATFVNEKAVVDGPFITGRWPADLPFHLARTLDVLENGTDSLLHSARPASPPEWRL